MTIDRPKLATDNPLMLIGGKRVAALSGKTIDVFDPATGTIIATVPDGEARDADSAVAARTEAFKRGPWAKNTASSRAKVMWRIADLLEQNVEELSQMESLNNGMLPQLAAGTVIYAAEMFRYYAGWATKSGGKTANLNGNNRRIHAFTLRQPIGVCALIIPWNAPIPLT